MFIYFLITFRVQLQQISHDQPTDTVQATPSPALQSKQSSIAKPAVSKEVVEFQNVCDSPSANPTITRATNPVVFANVAAEFDAYMQIESQQNIPPPLASMKHGALISDQ